MLEINCGILTGLPAGIKAVSKPAGTTGTGGSSAGGAGGSSFGGAGGSPAGSAGAASFHEEEPQSGEGSLDIYIYIYIYIFDSRYSMGLSGPNVGVAISSCRPNNGSLLSSVLSI